MFHRTIHSGVAVLLLATAVLIAFGLSTSGASAQQGQKGFTRRTVDKNSRLSSAVISTMQFGRSDGTSDKSFRLEGITRGGFRNEPAGSAPEAAEAAPANYKLNSDFSQFPHDETSVAIRKKVIVSGANDYRIGNPYNGFYTSQDKGATWNDGLTPIPLLTNTFDITEPPAGQGDPAIAIARDGTVYYASLGFSFTFCENGLFLYRSTNKGLTWTEPIVPDRGGPLRVITYWDSADSCFEDGAGPDVFHDKEYITVDNSGGPHDGRVYVTWTRYQAPDSIFSGYVEGPIYLAYSDDQGDTWTEVGEISGSSATLCTNQVDGEPPGHCDDDTASVPIVGPDGTLYVAFLNFQNSDQCWAPGAEPFEPGSFRSQYLVVKVNPDTFAATPPVQVACLVDGVDDYPVNTDGRQTLSNSNFRVWAAGNLARNPENGNWYVVWSDNRNGTGLGTPSVTTNTDIFVSVGNPDATFWSEPIRVNQDDTTNDQWFPWVATSNNRATVIYYDRRRDPIGNLMTNAFTSNTADEFTTIKDAKLSNSNFNPNYAFFEGLFIGDYLGIAFNGCRAFGAWADTRNANATDRWSDIFGAWLNVCNEVP